MGIAHIITEGPGHFDLFASLSEGDCESRRWIEFHLLLESSPGGSRRRLEARINGAKRESSAGQSWSITGDWRQTPTSREGRFEGWYNTKSRRGRLVLE